jgi:hypothetical protein
VVKGFRIHSRPENEYENEALLSVPGILFVVGGHPPIIGNTIVCGGDRLGDHY